MKVVPFPGPALATAIVPPIASTSDFVIVRPRPLPPASARARRVGAVETLEDAAGLLGRQPGPVVADRDDRRYGPSRGEAQLDLAAGGCVADRVADQVVEDLPEPRPVGAARRLGATAPGRGRRTAPRRAAGCAPAPRRAASGRRASRARGAGRVTRPARASRDRRPVAPDARSAHRAPARRPGPARTRRPRDPRRSHAPTRSGCAARGRRRP